MAKDAPHSGAHPPRPQESLVRTWLRGFAEVDLMPSALTGVFFVAALFVARWQFGLAGLMGVVVATTTAVIFGAKRDRITAGLEGFNGALVGVGLAVILNPDHASTWLLILVASIVVSVVTSALVTYLGIWKISTLTLPFCIVVSAVTMAAPAFQRTWHRAPGIAALPAPLHGSTTLGWTHIWRGFFTNFSQIFLIDKWLSGVLFLAGIFVASRRSAIMASLGSVIAILTAWILGSPATSIEQGLLGFNAILTAIALGGVFVALTSFGFIYAVIGAASATMLTEALTTFFTPIAGHTLTWPFVLTTLFFIAAVPAFSRLRTT